MLLGVDIGGTFTDFVLIDDVGRVRQHKRLTTPDDPARSVGEGVRELGLPESALVVHGSTIATNALLERRGARTALITTAGFADVLEIGRQNRPDLYALVPVKPPPLVPREWRFELRERVTAEGEILVPLDPAEVAALVPKLQAEQIESVAVCFLFSFLRPEHEQLVKGVLEAGGRRSEVRGQRSESELPISDLPPLTSISLSSEILPEYREYERTSTTVINAYVAPLVDRYLARLERALSPRPLRIMQSNGGCIPSAMARAQAARTALSGPAGGVVGAFEVARQSLISRKRLQSPTQDMEEIRDWTLRVEIITFDMGGTSTDVCLCPGNIPFTSEGEIGGLPLRLPMIDIHTVGAGGGSLARVDAGGALTVGPESAGADPGPACYGRGGLLPTVTDANLILNRLHPAHFLGGRMALDREAARAALRPLQTQTQTRTLGQTAWGVVQVANAAMERAIRKISIERGFDPRDFTLVAFGGAGPLHACELAERLGISRVLAPRAPGVLSALGMLLADLVKDYSLTILRRVESLTEGDVPGLFAPLEARARAEMSQDGVADPQLERSVDVRYVGQSFEINVPLVEDRLAQLTDDFHARHAQRYGHAHPAEPVEWVTLRVRAAGRTPKPIFEELPLGTGDPAAAGLGEQPVWFEVGGSLAPYPARLYEREKLLAGDKLAGPAVIFQLDATTVIPPGWAGQVDRLGHLRLERQ
ncbi:MAG: hydantoinase/oxoprolinase family protein [Anaerolineales bacterium]